MEQAISATPAARHAIAHLRETVGPLMFVQSHGCCDGSEPMCYPLGEFRVGASDLLLGEIDGNPYYMEAAHYERLGKPQQTLDVAAGSPGGFSLPAGEDQHFVVRTTHCTVALLPLAAQSDTPPS